MPLDIGLLISIATSIISALGWYRSYTRSSYAQERQTSHIVEALNELCDSSDEVSDRLSRLEIILLNDRSVKRG